MASRELLISLVIILASFLLFSFIPSSAAQPIFTDPCFAFNDSCVDCAAQANCIYCENDESCRTGDEINGPADGDDTCVIQIGCPTVPCNEHDDCDSCTADPLCGWCQGTVGGVCLEGDDTGPTIPTDCPAPSIFFRDSCVSPISCGNGILDNAEECDDGNRVNDDFCSNICSLNLCGNLRVDPGEECDSTNVTLCNPPYTLNACQFVTCGDGVVDFGEQCDAGVRNGRNSNCSTTCQFRNGTYCGDGVVQCPSNEGICEQCDLGEDNGGLSGCSTTCRIAICGDGIVEGTEQCDLGAGNGFANCAFDCTPAPVVFGLLRDSGLAIDLFLRYNTSFSGVFACSQLFQRRTLTLLGTDPICRPKSNTDIVIELPSDATIVPGDLMYFLAGVIVNATGSSIDSVALLPPYHPAIPAVHVQWARKIPSCYLQSADPTLTLDATGIHNKGGRPWKFFSWSLSANSAGVNTALRDVLNTANGSQSLLVNFPASILAGSRLGVTETVVLTLTNWLNQTASLSMPMTVTNRNTIMLVPDGPSSITTSPQASLVLSDTVLNPCDLNYDRLDFAWTRAGGPLYDVSLVRRASLVPAIPFLPYTLAANSTYSLQLSAAIENRLDTVTTNFKTVTERDPGILAVIAGGYRRRIAFTDALVLDATPSTDLGNTADSWVFRWDCADPSNYEAGCISQPYLTNGAIQTIPAETLAPGFHYFFLEVQKGAGRVNRTYVIIEVSFDTIPLIALSIVPQPGFQQLPTVTRSQSLAIQANLSGASVGSYSVSWSVYSAAETSASLFTLVSNTPTTISTIIFEGSSLKYDSVYDVLATVTDTVTGAYGYAAITFTTADDPALGSCSIESSGVAGDPANSYQVACSGFELEFPYFGPLQYAFYNEYPDGSLTNIFTSPSLDNSVDLIVQEGAVNILVVVLDSEGGATPWTLSLTPPATGTRSLVARQTPAYITSEYLYGLTNTSLNEVSVQKIPSILQALISSLNNNPSSGNAQLREQIYELIADGSKLSPDQDPIDVLSMKLYLLRQLTNPADINELSDELLNNILNYLSTTLDPATTVVYRSARTSSYVVAILSNIYTASAEKNITLTQNIFTIIDDLVYTQQQFSNFVAGSYVPMVSNLFTVLLKRFPANTGNYTICQRGSCIALPPGVFQGFSPLAVIDAEFRYFTVNPYSYLRYPTAAPLSNLIGVKLFTQSGPYQLPQRALRDILITLPFNEPLDSGERAVGLYIEDYDQYWKTDGCTTQRPNSTQIIMSCNHLTDFAAFPFASFVDANVVSPDAVNLATSNFHVYYILIVLALLGALVVCCIILAALWLRRRKTPYVPRPIAVAPIPVAATTRDEDYDYSSSESDEDALRLKKPRRRGDLISYHRPDYSSDNSSIHSN